MPSNLFSQDISIGYFDVDPRLRVSATAYWRILQNAAAAHAASLGASTEELRRGGLTWMLSRMVLSVDRHPSIGDALSVETWPSTKLRGVRAYRDFVLKDQGRVVLASAASLWVMVDLTTRKPVRVPDAIVQLRHDPGYQIPEFSEDLTPVASQPAIFRAAWSDCDQNEHVNNVAYVRWAIDSLPTAFLETHTLGSLEIHYLKEIALGAELQVHTSVEGQEVRQSILDPQGQLAASIASKWIPCPAAANS